MDLDPHALAYAPARRTGGLLMRLLVKIAWRSQSRFAAWTAVGALAVGVAAATSVRTLVTDFQKRLHADSREWLGADVAVHTKDEIGEAQVPGTAHTVVTECITMARSDSAADPLIVSLKSVDPSAYPLYGAITLSPSLSLSDALAADGAAVSQGLLERLRLRTGDSLRIGSGFVHVSAIIRAEPDRYATMPNAFERVIISRASFDRIYSAGFGASLTHRVLFRGSPGEKMLRDAFPGAEITHYREADPSAVAALELTSAFLQFVALAAFSLAMIAFAASARVRVEGRLDTIALLRSVGARRSQWFGVFFMESLLVAVTGATIGLAISVPVTVFLAHKAGSHLAIDVRAGWNFSIAAEMLAWSIAVAIASSWTPLLAAASTSVSAIFRRHVEPRRTPAVFMLAIVCGATASGMNAVVAAAAGTGLVVCLVLISRAAFRGIAKLAAGPITRCAVRNLTRPDFRTGVTLGVLIAGVMLLSAIHTGRNHVAREVLASVPGLGDHNLLVVGTGKAHIERIIDKLGSHRAVQGRTTKVPLAWLRLKTIDGLGHSSGKQMWFATCGDQPDGTIGVSSGRARLLGLTNGSRLTFATDQGDIQATAAIIRTGNAIEDVVYGFILPCRVLGALPLFYYGAARVDPPSEVDTVRRWLASEDPTAGTLAAAELRQISERLASDALSMLEMLSVLALAGGVVLLALFVAATQSARSQELAILRVLGATRHRIVQLLMTEFGLLCAVATAAGTVAGFVLASAALSVIIGRTIFVFSWTYLENTALAGALIAAGVTASLPALRGRPMDVLRED